MPSCRSATICSQISAARARSEEHTSELQSRLHLVCRLLLEKKKNTTTHSIRYHPRTYPHDITQNITTVSAISPTDLDIHNTRYTSLWHAPWTHRHSTPLPGL